MQQNKLLEKPKSIVNKLLIGILFGFIIFLILAILGDIRSIKDTLQNFNWIYLPVALSFTLFNYFLRFIKWHFYVNNINNLGIKIFESLRIFIAGFPLAVTPGKVGEILKGFWLKKSSGLPVAKGISIVVAERISDGLAVLILSTLGVFAYPKYWPAFLIVLIILFSIIILSQIKPAALWIIAIIKKIPLINKFSSNALEFYEGSNELFKPKAIFIAVLLGIISWLGEGIGFYFILVGLGFDPGLQLAGIAIFVLSFSTIIGAISALPGGLGAAEASIAGMLMLTLGTSSTLAASATLLIRFATLWFGVLLGIITWVISPRLFSE